MIVHMAPSTIRAVLLVTIYFYQTYTWILAWGGGRGFNNVFRIRYDYGLKSCPGPVLTYVWLYANAVSRLVL